MPASVKQLTEALAWPAARQPLTEAGRRPARLRPPKKRSRLIRICSSVETSASKHVCDAALITYAYTYIKRVCDNITDTCYKTESQIIY